MNESTGWWLDEYDGPRFWKYVNPRGGAAHESDPLATAEGDCWIWTGTKDKDGYGMFRMGPKNVMAYRVSYLDGSRSSRIPAGFEVDHLCRNPACVRPSHLEAVSHQVNVARGARGRNAVVACPSGHPYSEENTKLLLRKGREVRYCAICLTASKQRTRERARTK